MARAPKAPTAPNLPSDLALRAVTSVRAFDTVEECRIEECDLGGQVAQKVVFDTVRIERGTMAASKLAKLRWSDVVCARCDLSTVVWNESKLSRVELRDCRLTGATFTDSELEDVRFVGCHLGYATFARARFRQVTFEACRLDEAHFGSANLQGTSFQDCELRGVDLEGASLKDVDVTTSRLGELKVGLKDLKGLIVNREQAASLASMLGLVVR